MNSNIAPSHIIAYKNLTKNIEWRWKLEATNFTSSLKAKFSYKNYVYELLSSFSALSSVVLNFF